MIHSTFLFLSIPAVLAAVSMKDEAGAGGRTRMVVANALGAWAGLGALAALLGAMVSPNWALVREPLSARIHGWVDL